MDESGFLRDTSTRPSGAFRAPRSEPREESGLQFAASGRFLSPVPVRDEASGFPTSRPRFPPVTAGRLADQPNFSVRDSRLRELASATARPLNFDSPPILATTSPARAPFNAPRRRCGLRLRFRFRRPLRLAAPTGLAFLLGLSALSRTRRPLVSPGEAGGSPWLRDHFDTALRADNRGCRKGCVRTGARPVHNLGKSLL
jgi:hypothetical protein